MSIYIRINNFEIVLDRRKRNIFSIISPSDPLPSSLSHLSPLQQSLSSMALPFFVSCGLFVNTFFVIRCDILWVFFFLAIKIKFLSVALLVLLFTSIFYVLSYNSVAFILFILKYFQCLVFNLIK